MPTKGYIAGKPVSRWDTESENIDIEYRNLEQKDKACLTNFFSGKKGFVLKVLILVILFVVGMVVGYLIRRNVHERFILPKLKPAYGVQQDYSEEISRKIRDDLHYVVNFEDHINQTTKKIHLSGLGDINKLIEYVKDYWNTEYFDSVKIKKYNVVLSYPNYLGTRDERNQVNITDKTTGKTVFQSHENFSNIHPDYLPFNAYSPSGYVKGDLVYANYGRDEDFNRLIQLGVNITGQIVIIRYGKIHPGNKVNYAEQYGAKGVILYPDPYDYANNQSNVYPNTWWLPGWAIPRSHVRKTLTGDPGTPDYTSSDQVHRIPMYNSSYPQIPVHTVSYNDAHHLLKNLARSDVPMEWVGGLNLTYQTGPGFHNENWYVLLNVSNHNERRDISNVMAVIKGKYEKDKYIIIGAHLDSWSKGAVDSGSGFAVLMELAKAFSNQVGHGWRPRRSIIFCLWDAAKYGHIGAYEWVQEYGQQLSAGAVAYINLEEVVKGNYSFSASATPMLFDLIHSASKSVHSPDVDFSDQTVYDRWRKKFPDSRFKPRINLPGGDTDIVPFLSNIGVSVLSPTYTYNTQLYSNLSSFPVKNTLYDTMSYLRTFIDSDFKLHITVTQIVAEILLRLSDSALLPLNVKEYTSVLRAARTELINLHASSFQTAHIKILSLIEAIDNFSIAADSFHQSYSSIKTNNISEFDLYLKNDQLMQLPRAFILDTGLTGQEHHRNVLIAPHPDNLYETVIFPGVYAGIEHGKKTNDWCLLRKEISKLVVALQRACDILQEGMLNETDFPV